MRHSWSLIDWGTSDAKTTPHFVMAFIAFFFMAGAAGAAALFMAFFIAFMAAMVPSHECCKRVAEYKVSCLSLRPTTLLHNEHYTQKNAHQHEVPSLFVVGQNNRRPDAHPKTLVPA